MPQDFNVQVLVEDRVAQLHAISERRNALLRQMYQMMRRRQNAGLVLALDEESGPELHAFLERFDLAKNPETGSIANLSEDEVLAAPASHHTLPSSERFIERVKPELDDDQVVLDQNEKLSNTSRASSHTQGVDATVHFSPIASDFSSLHQSPELIYESPSAMLSIPVENVIETGDSLADVAHSKFDITQEAKDVSDQEMQWSSEENSVGGPPTQEHIRPILANDTSILVDQDARTPSSLVLENQMNIDAPHSPKLEVSHVPFISSVAAVHRPPIVILCPPESANEPKFVFNTTSNTVPLSSNTTTTPTQHRYQFNPNYTLPPLKYLPIEFHRRGKPTKQQRKREKEREKVEGRKEKDNKDDWFPMGLNRWAATINANPVWKRVSRATKCLSTREWAIAMSELRLIRTLDRVESLKDGGRWSFRQPKKQRGVGGLTKTHWDHLMDEMKWMRIDFREEHKWKMALAYNLSTAVLEWHAAGSPTIRLSRGICVQWKRPRDNASLEDSEDAQMDIDASVPFQGNSKASLLGVDYQSDDDDDDERDNDQQSIVDALEPTSLIQDAFESVNGVGDDPNTDSQPMESSETTNSSESQNHSMSVDVVASGLGDIDVDDMLNVESSSRLKATSKDPILGVPSTSQSNHGEGDQSILLWPQTRPTTKAVAYTATRERIAYSGDEQLFLDLGGTNENAGSGIANDNLSSSDLTAIFPDLQPLQLLDVVPVIAPSSVSEGKKKVEKRSDRDDPNKRIEDVTYTKLFPATKFMFSKPTLLGSLQPSKRWKEGHWMPLEEVAVAPESENSVKISDDSVSELFDSRSSNSPATIIQMQMQAALLKEKDPRQRGADHLWTTTDDTVLKSYIDKYPNNWLLIAECFNASRLNASTDKRTMRDCAERWKEKWGPDTRLRASDPNSMTAEDTPPPATPQMTTRGVKRLASSSTSGPSVSGIDHKKRRRHLLIQETIRKAGKKRAEAVQKANANQRKPPTIHETHNQYSKMPKHTPAELSRLKADKEARDAQDIQLVRRRQEELSRQNIQREQAHRLQTPNPQAQLLQQQQANGQRPAIPAPPPALPQIRSQVNISQQQRVGTPSAAAANARLSPQQLLQVQTQQARVVQQQTQQAQVQALAIAQAQAQAQGSNGTNVNGNGVGVPMNGSHPPPAHASPPNVATVPANVSSPLQASPQPSAQPIASQVAGSTVPRPATNVPPHYYASNFTPEQIHSALRLQMLQQQQSAQNTQNT